MPVVVRSGRIFAPSSSGQVRHQPFSSTIQLGPSLFVVADVFSRASLKEVKRDRR
jgi:hypothetical protein